MIMVLHPGDLDWSSMHSAIARLECKIERSARNYAPERRFMRTDLSSLRYSLVFSTTGLSVHKIRITTETYIIRKY